MLQLHVHPAPERDPHARGCRGRAVVSRAATGPPAPPARPRARPEASLRAPPAARRFSSRRASTPRAGCTARCASASCTRSPRQRCGTWSRRVASPRASRTRLRPPPPPSRTKWTRPVHPSVLIGHVSSLFRSSPVFRDDAGVGLARPSTVYSVAAYATCALCGMARSAAARARYEIVAGCLPPAAKSSATLKASAPAHVCAGGIDNGQPCFGSPAAQRPRPRVPRAGAA